MPVTMVHRRRYCRKVFTFDIAASHHDRNGEVPVRLQPTRTGSRIERLEEGFE